MAGTLAAIQDEQVCVRVDEWKCRALAGVERIAWGSEGASLAALVDGKVVRFAADGDDPAAWPAPEEIGTVEDACDLAVSPEGVDRGLHGRRARTRRRRPGPAEDRRALRNRLPGRDAARRRAGDCGADPQIRLADIESGATRALDGDKGEHFAFK